MAKKKENKPKDEKPRVNKELDGFDIQVNSFGEIIANYDVDKINQFLNRNVDDKKLRHRDDIPDQPGKKKEEAADSDADES